MYPRVDNGQLNGSREDQRHPERDVSPQGPPPDRDDNGSDHHTDGSFLPVGFQVVSLRKCEVRPRDAPHCNKCRKQLKPRQLSLPKYFAASTLVPTPLLPLFEFLMFNSVGIS